jgi:hypothetical protein
LTLSRSRLQHEACDEHHIKGRSAPQSWALLFADEERVNAASGLVGLNLLEQISDYVFHHRVALGRALRIHRRYVTKGKE